jgi:cell division septation protein DedD
MDSRLKQRLIGAAVLVALAVIFLPMLVQGPAPDSGVSDVPLSMPDTPRGAYETRDLPLVTPGDAPDGGAVGMAANPTAAVASPPAGSGAAPAASDDTPAEATPLDVASAADKPAAAATPPPAASNPATATKGEMFPPATAGGDYAVSFGTYGTTGAADAIVASLRASQLPGYRQPTTANGKPAWRVRIGPYASRAQAEAARLRAAHVRDDVGASVVVLDAQATAAPAAGTTVATGTAPATKAPTVAAPAPAPPPAATAAAASVGFAVQLAAFSKPDDAAALRDRLRAAGFNAFIESVATDHGTLTRVRAGPVQSRAEAGQLQAQIKAKLGLDGVVRPLP